MRRLRSIRFEESRKLNESRDEALYRKVVMQRSDSGNASESNVSRNENGSVKNE